MKRLWGSYGNDRDEIRIRIAQCKAQRWPLWTNYPSNSMEHSPSESNSSSAAQIFPTFLRNQNVQSLIHNSPPLGPFLSHMNRVHSLTPNLFTIHFIIPSTTVSSKWSLSLRFHYQNLVSPYMLHAPPISSSNGRYQKPCNYAVCLTNNVITGQVLSFAQCCWEVKSCGVWCCVIGLFLVFQSIGKYVPNDTGSTFYKTCL